MTSRRCRGVLAVCLSTVLVLCLTTTASASIFAFDRAFGWNVDGGSPGVGYEVCTVAASCQAGATGTLGGQFQTIRGVATDAAGNTYVADSGNRRIQKFDAAGNFVATWGKDVTIGGGTGYEICTVATSCKAGVFGGLGGEFQNGPDGVAVDAAGNVYVADGSRVTKFTSAGAFVRLWGKDVLVGGTTGPEICTVAANCQPGNLLGVLGGEFNGASNVATGPGGAVYVSDGRRIQKFDSGGAFERTWGKDVSSGGGTGFEVCVVAASCKAGEEGSLGGEFGNPRGLAVDAAGNVYTGDFTKFRIQKFDSTGNWQSAWGKDVISGGGTGAEICTAAAACKAGEMGELGGEFAGGMSLATDPAGNVFVGDGFGDRVQELTSGGEFILAFGDGVGRTSPGFSVCRAAAECHRGLVVGTAGGSLQGSFGLGVDASGNVYVSEFDNQRLQKFVPAPDPSFIFDFGRVRRSLLFLRLPGPGVVSLVDGSTKGKDLLGASTATGGPGDISVPLKLTKAGKKKLKKLKKGKKLKVVAAVTYTPDDGLPNTVTKTLKLKG